MSMSVSWFCVQQLACKHNFASSGPNSWKCKSDIWRHKVMIQSTANWNHGSCHFVCLFFSWWDHLLTERCCCAQSTTTTHLATFLCNIDSTKDKEWIQDIQATSWLFLLVKQHMQSSVFDKMTGKEVQQSNSSWKDGMWVQLSGHLHIETLTWTMSHVGVETEAITTCWLHNAENWTLWSNCKRHQMQQNHWQNGCSAPHSSMPKMIKTTLWQTTLKMKWKWICQTHAKLHVILRFDQSLMQHVTCSSQSRRSGTLLAMPATPWVPSKHLKSFFHNQTTISKPFLVSNNNWHHLGTLS